MIPVGGVVPICGHRLAPPDMLEVFRSSTHCCRGEGPSPIQPHGPERARSISRKAIEGCATRASRIRVEPTCRVIPSPSAHSMASGQLGSTEHVRGGCSPVKPLRTQMNLAAVNRLDVQADRQTVTGSAPQLRAMQSSPSQNAPAQRSRVSPQGKVYRVKRCTAQSMSTPPTPGG
jgi:hypothetical protein